MSVTAVWRLAGGTLHAGPAEESTSQIEARFSESAKRVELDSSERVPGSCVTCVHRLRPGLTDPGYCGGGRVDLAPAYGDDHPLRRLPADGGAACHHWQSRS